MGKGVVIVLGCAVAGLAVSIAFDVASGGMGLALLLGIGVVQALWVVPLWRHYRKVGETETAKGILIMASVVFLFLLNPGCWGLIATVGIP